MEDASGNGHDGEIRKANWVVWFGGSLEGIQCYAVLEADLLRRKIIRRNVCIALARHTRGIAQLLKLFI